MNKRSFWTIIKMRWQLYVMLIPGMVSVLVFCYGPLYGITLAFKDYNRMLGMKSPWAGLDNFRLLFRQPNFLRVIGNTLSLSLWKMFLGILVPVTVSLLLNEVRNSAAKRMFQTIVYIPNFLSWVIMGGVFAEIFASDGIVNVVLGSMGIPFVNFMGSSKIFPWTLILTDVWKGFGFGTVVYLAALAGIDPSLYEAAIMDGAGRWKQTRYITIPMLLPTMALMLILSMGGVLSAGFDQVFNMYSPIVYSTGDIIDTYVYRTGIADGRFDMGTAIGLFKSVVSAILMAISYYLADRVAGYRVF